MNRLNQPVVYLISDLHLGQGRSTPGGNWDRLEDFRVDEAFCRFLDHISSGEKPVELVIAGDFIEYLQIMPDLGLTSPVDHLGTTESQSLQRTFVVLGQTSVATGHPDLFRRLRRFLDEGNRLTILAGNHDVDLLWPRVWLLLYYNLCPPGMVDKLRLERYNYTIGTADHGRIYIEHGHEHDQLNCFGDKMHDPFDYDSQGEKRLKRPWGTLFVDRVFNQLEEQCWFVDNVKPIWRVIKLGLHGDFSFTATAMALMAKFFLTKGAPFFSFNVPGLAQTQTVQRSADIVVEAVDDPELRQHMEQRIASDPTFRAEFEQEMQRFSMTEQQEMQRMKVDAAAEPWEEKQQTPPAGMSFRAVFNQHDEPVEEDVYQRAARAVLEQDPHIATVVMGHTHRAIDRYEIVLDDGRVGTYFNSGTWTPHLIERSRPYTWDDLGNHENYRSSLHYLRFVPDEQGAYHAELRSWSET